MAEESETTEEKSPNQQATDAVANISEEVVPSDIMLSSGVQLHLKKSPPFVVAQAVSNIQRPEVPMWKNEDKQREEPNPTDPAYEKALLEYHGATGTAIMNALLLFGVDIVEVPEKLPAVDSDDWLEALTYLGIDPPKTRQIRKLLWLKTVALTEDSDIQAVSTALFAIQGIGEEDVAQAIESFRSGSERGADNAGASSENGANRNPVSRAGRRARATSGGKRRRKA